MSAEIPRSSPDLADQAAAPTATRVYTPQAGMCYRVNSSRCSLVELWRDVRSPMVLIAWISKLLRIKLPGSVNDPHVVSLRPFVVPANTVKQTIAEDIRHKLAPVARELKELGFSGSTFFLIDDLFQHSHIVQVALLHNDGRSVARITHRVEGVQREKTHFFTEFLSAFADDTFLYSSSASAQLNTPAQCRLNWQPKASTSQLWVMHRQALDAAAKEGGNSINCYESIGLVDVLERHHEMVRDFHLQRGVFSSMQGDDLAHVQALDRNIEKTQENQLLHPEVLAQLERLQNKRANLTSGIIILIVSIGFFIALGVTAWGQTWQLILMIVAVLLVHEAGHYLAMRVFKYRNVQMFFIPLLGAAVSGHNYTAPAWKKIVVSLMGPLPGIFLGSVLGIAGLVRGNETFINVALLTIILNGLQLLPIFPLDGGRVVHALLFSRHYYLDTVFLVIAATLLAGGGAALGDNILMGFGLVMFIGVPVSHKVAKLARDMRQLGFLESTIAQPAAGVASTVAIEAKGTPPALSGLTSPVPATSVADDTSDTASVDPKHGAIPEPIAEVIIGQIKKRFPRFKSPKQIAQVTLRVYETLVTRPPGIGASIGFGLLHIGSIAATLLMLAVIVAARNPDFLTLLAANAVNPTRALDPAAIRIWESPTYSASIEKIAPSETGDDVTTIGVPQALVASFSSSQESQDAFDELRQSVSASARLIQFGQTVMLSTPDSEVAIKWFDSFENLADDVFINGGETYATLTLTCEAQDRATAAEIVEQINAYFGFTRTFRLIPPWVGDELDSRSAMERAQHDKARGVFRQLESVYVYDAPELDALRNEMDRATRRNEQDKIDRLSKELSRIQDELQIRELERTRDEEIPPEFHELADQYIAFSIESQEVSANFNSDTPEAYEAWSKSIDALEAKKGITFGPMMGQWPDSQGDANANRRVRKFALRYGYARDASRGKLVVTVGFSDLSHAAPVFVKWLQRRGCEEFWYEFESTGSMIFDWDD